MNSYDVFARPYWSPAHSTYRCLSFLSACTLHEWILLTLPLVGQLFPCEMWETYTLSLFYAPRLLFNLWPILPGLRGECYIYFSRELVRNPVIPHSLKLAHFQFRWLDPFFILFWYFSFYSVSGIEILSLFIWKVTEPFSIRDPRWLSIWCLVDEATNRRSIGNLSLEVPSFDRFVVVLGSSPDLRLDDGLGSIYALWIIPLNPPMCHIARVLTKAYGLFWQGPATNPRIDISISGSFFTFFALKFCSITLTLYPVIRIPSSNSYHAARRSRTLRKWYPLDQSLISWPYVRSVNHLQSTILVWLGI